MNNFYYRFDHVWQIKEGAEKLREVTTDRRSLSDVASIVKKSNSKLAELKSELHELESQILLTKGNSVSNGQGKFSLYFFSIFETKSHLIDSFEWRRRRFSTSLPIFALFFIQLFSRFIPITIFACSYQYLTKKNDFFHFAQPNYSRKQTNDFLK